MSTTVIKKAYLYDDEGGTVYRTYAEWAVEDIQDSEAAFEIGQRMVRDGSGVSDNFDEHARVFEVYTITSVIDFVAQMNAYQRGWKGADGTRLHN